MPPKAHISAALLLASIASSPLAAQTIPERVRTAGSNPVVVGRLVDVFPSTLDQLMEGADVVVEATLNRIESYLSANEDHILTDFEIVPHRIFAGRLPGATRVTPGRTARPILARYGGELTIDGVRASAVDHAMGPVKDGGRYLLFLVPFGADRKYQTYKAGAFEMGGPYLRSLVGRNEAHLFKDLVEPPLDDVIARIVSFAAARGK
jgi:hypothetical protein